MRPEKRYNNDGAIITQSELLSLAVGKTRHVENDKIVYFIVTKAIDNDGVSAGFIATKSVWSKCPAPETTSDSILDGVFQFEADDLARAKVQAVSNCGDRIMLQKRINDTRAREFANDETRTYGKRLLEAVKAL